MDSLKASLTVIGVATAGGEESFALSAVRRDEAGLTTFLRFIETDEPVPPSVLKAQGLPTEALRAARAIEAVREDFLAFLPPAGIFLAHDAATVRAWLRRALPGAFEHALLSTRELAGILFPSVGSHELRGLTESLGLQPAPDAPDPGFRFAQDGLLTLSLWDLLVEEGESLPGPLLRELYSLFAPLRSHPLCRFFKACVDAQRPAGGVTMNMFERKFGEVGIGQQRKPRGLIGGRPFFQE